MKNKTFVVGSIVLAVGVFVLLKVYSPALETKTETAATENAGSFVRPHSPSYGNTLGRVTVVEWFDPACESCREVHPFVKKIISEYSDRVHFVLRYMPYHQGSMFAAAVLEEAKEIGKFEEALNILFEKQPEWADHHAPKPELIPGYLSKLGIAKENLDEESVVKKHSAKIRMDEADGNKIGVRGTPSFFVNGKPVRGIDEAMIRGSIENALTATR